MALDRKVRVSNSETKASHCDALKTSEENNVNISRSDSPRGCTCARITLREIQFSAKLKLNFSLKGDVHRQVHTSTSL